MSTITVSDIPLQTTSPAQRLRRTAAAVRVHFTWWGVRRSLSAQQKEEVGDAYGADARLLSAGKKIIDCRHEAVRRMTAIRTRTVSYWRGLSLPFTEPGVRLIRQSDIESFVHAMEGFRAELTEAEADLNAVYDNIRADARSRLGRLYNSNDYPDEIRELFGVEWDFPTTEPPNYLLRLHPDLYHQEQQRVAQRFEEAVQLAERAFIAEFAKLVSHLTERLANGEDGDRRIFRDSVVGNLTEFFDRFKQLNVGSSEELEHLVEQAQQLVQGVTPQELRDNDGLRQHVASQMAQVEAQLDGMIVDQPRRHIIRSNPSLNGGANGVGH